MKQPNAIVHMTWHGLRAGIIYGAAFACVVFLFATASSGFDTMDALLGGLFAWLTISVVGAFFGGPLGLALGFLSGFAMDWQQRRLPQPFSADDLAQFRRQTRLLIFIIAGIGALVLPVIFFDDVVAAFIFFVPAIISAIVAIRVANKYFDKLADFHKPKRKVKEKQI